MLIISNWDSFILKFVIWTPVYRDNSGGIIVLHKLASMLREAGHSVSIWPQPKPSKHELKAFHGWIKLTRWFKFLAASLIKRREISSPYELQVAKNRDLENSVVVYPEITAGNPLGEKCVVRWLLNKPGVINGNKEFGSNDLFFYFNVAFNDWELNPNADQHLNVSELKSNIYFNFNNEDRSGQCYMVRKGRNRSQDYHDPSAEKVDGLSHEDLAKVFNKCKYFICYDLYTLYNRYAAMCGCIPIVVPQQGLTKEEWLPEIEWRYGVAYGWEDIAWAVKTRGKLIEAIEEIGMKDRESVSRFVAITERYFADQ